MVLRVQQGRGGVEGGSEPGGWVGVEGLEIGERGPLLRGRVQRAPTPRPLEEFLFPWNWIEGFGGELRGSLPGSLGGVRAQGVGGGGGRGAPVGWEWGW